MVDSWDFQCPECGGHYFGSTQRYWDRDKFIRTPGIYKRHCNDQFGVGCRWSGSSEECDRRILGKGTIANDPVYRGC
jgi:hypothetical protein